MEEAGSRGSAPAKSFSELSQLPPLKESGLSSEASVDETAAPEAVPERSTKDASGTEVKTQIQQTAERTIAELRKIPPRLYLYALGGALIVMAMIGGGILLQSYLEEREQERPSASAPPPAPPPSPQKPSSPAPPPNQAALEEKAQDEQPVTSEPPAESAPTALEEQDSRHKRAHRRTVRPVQSAQLTISSTPAGADISFDGKLLCQSPCTLTDIPPGEHLVAAAKSGYSRQSRPLRLSSGANSSLSLELSLLAASVSVASTPAGAVILIDGQDTGKLTPSELKLAKPGAHTVVLRRTGYLEETSSVEAQAGQTANVNVALKRLGSTEEIRPAGGKFKKWLGHDSKSTMGIVSVKTQPKGAQIMVNNRVLDKTSPFDFYLNPGTYVLDITMMGYHSVHRVINVEQQEKVAIEEALTPE
jgi:hypothetical protein